MSPTKLRTILYTTAIVLAAGLLFAGFGITIPPDPGTRLHGATLVAALGEFDSALDMCDKVIEEHPDNVEARVYRATFLAQAERYDESLKAYDDALRHNDDPKLGRSLRADRTSVLLHAGRTEDYRRARDELAAEKVDYVLHMLDGIAARRGRDWGEAEAAFRRALKDDSKDRNARSLLVDVLVSRGAEALAARRFDESLDAYRTAQAVDPERVDVALKTAEVHLALEQELDAVKVLKAVGLKHRGVAPLLCRAASALWERGSKERAFDVLATAYNADATSTTALFDKDPVWSKLRETTSLKQIVSKRNGSSNTGLPDSGTVIGSPRQND